jgi:serine/threonine-protein kinase
MWIAMELVDGMPLRELLRQSGPQPLDTFVPLFERLCEVVQSAHDQGIVHRDIKPANVMVIERAGRLLPKLLDFGVAKLVALGDALAAAEVGLASAAMDWRRLTHLGQILGSPAYMAPEQWRDAATAGPPADQYALALLAYEALTGARAFAATTVQAFAEQHRVLPLPALPSHLPAALHAVLSRATDKLTERRFSSVTELANAIRCAALGAASEGAIIVAHPREPAPAPSPLRPGIPSEVDRPVLRCVPNDPAQGVPTAGELATAIDGPPGGLRPSSLTPTEIDATATAPTSATRTRDTALAKRSRAAWIVAMAGLGAAGLSGAGAGFGIGIAAVTIGESDALAPARLPASAAPRASPPAPAPPPAPPDPSAQVAPIMKTALAHFVAWSRDHPGAPCPDAAALGVPGDPWGTPPRVTCTDQPGDQIAGAISAGPDGQHGTADDLASWQLGRDITDLVRGTRWLVAPPPPVVKPVTQRPSAPGRAAMHPKKPGLAVPVDEDGLPMMR